jgi:hypothetical protein
MAGWSGREIKRWLLEIDCKPAADVSWLIVKAHHNFLYIKYCWIKIGSTRFRIRSIQDILDVCNERPSKSLLITHLGTTTRVHREELADALSVNVNHTCLVHLVGSGKILHDLLLIEIDVLGVKEGLSHCVKARAKEKMKK